MIDIYGLITSGDHTYSCNIAESISIQLTHIVDIYRSLDSSC